ncbi:MAG: hypothetical protein K2H09_01265 [Treponemataceae bacterium]|nr:hypothetical protein [Treponemataceae bacterium]
MRSDYKEFLRVYGIFVGMLVFFFLVSIVMIRLSDSFWRTGLQAAVESVLEEKQPGRWKVEQPMKINSPFSTSAALYRVRDAENGSRGFAAVVRIATLYGPVPAVFVCDKDGTVSFMGCSAVRGRIKLLVEERPQSLSVNYWRARLADIIAVSEVLEK